MEKSKSQISEQLDLEDKNMNDARKKQKHDVEYQILTGSFKKSMYSSFSLLVPVSDIFMILEALNSARDGLHNWSICEDTKITTLENIRLLSDAGCLPIRSLQDDTIPANLSETELLDWLVHGESYYSKKYIVVDVKSGKRDWLLYKYTYEITKEEHLDPFYDAVKQIVDKYIYNHGDEGYYFHDATILDQGHALLEPTKKSIVVDHEMLKYFEEGASYDECNEWIGDYISEL